MTIPTREEMDHICAIGTFRKRPVLTEWENDWYCKFADYIEMDLQKQLKETNTYVPSDDYYADFCNHLENGEQSNE